MKKFIFVLFLGIFIIDYSNAFAGLSIVIHRNEQMKAYADCAISNLYKNVNKALRGRASRSQNIKIDSPKFETPFWSYDFSAVDALIDQNQFRIYMNWSGEAVSLHHQPVPVKIYGYISVLVTNHFDKISGYGIAEDRLEYKDLNCTLNKVTGISSETGVQFLDYSTAWDEWDARVPMRSMKIKDLDTSYSIELKKDVSFNDKGWSDTIATGHRCSIINNSSERTGALFEDNNYSIISIFNHFPSLPLTITFWSDSHSPSEFEVACTDHEMTVGEVEDDLVDGNGKHLLEFYDGHDLY